jgi:hypothetical protein
MMTVRRSKKWGKVCKKKIDEKKNIDRQICLCEQNEERNTICLNLLILRK